MSTPSTAQLTLLILLCLVFNLARFIRRRDPNGLLYGAFFALLVFAGFSVLETVYEQSPYACGHPDADPAACFANFRSYALSALLDHGRQDLYLGGSMEVLPGRSSSMDLHLIPLAALFCFGSLMVVYFGTECGVFLWERRGAAHRSPEDARELASNAKRTRAPRNGDGAAEQP